MKKILYLSLVVFLVACGNEQSKEMQETTSSNEVKETINYKDATFDDLFVKVEADKFNENLFSLFKNNAVLTSGTPDDFNSMAIGFGGYGQYFEGPATWCFLRANRFTLEYMRNTKSYTISFFDPEYENEVLHFGMSSGRDTDKMGTHNFNSVYTPTNNVSYKEAKVIIECDLSEITTVSPDDFYNNDSRKFVEEGFEEAKDYHKLVFGKITNIWICKSGQTHEK
jgi:flavin reductase (DIM6/NTAB) family NADH-FMN oxidoreductase RutF